MKITDEQQIRDKRRVWVLAKRIKVDPDTAVKISDFFLTNPNDLEGEGRRIYEVFSYESWQANQALQKTEDGKPLFDPKTKKPVTRKVNRHFDELEQVAIFEHWKTGIAANTIPVIQAINPNSGYVEYVPQIQELIDDHEAGLNASELEELKKLQEQAKNRIKEIEARQKTTKPQKAQKPTE